MIDYLYSWVGVILWIILGITGFVYWYTKDTDLTNSYIDIFLIMIGAIGGPVSWIIGWIIHGDKPFFSKTIVLVRRRDKRSTHE